MFQLSFMDWAILVGIFFLFYPYVVYPLLLTLAAKIFGKTPPTPDMTTPVISILVPCYNAEDNVEFKIKNLLDLDYPKDNLELILVSDFSEDRTDDIIQQYAQKHAEIKFLRTPERYGKEKALQMALQEARGEVIVLNDCTTFMKPDALQVVAKAFSDPEVGVISSVDMIPSDNKTPEYYYVKFEMYVRALESKIGSLPSSSGSLFAARRHLCMDNPNHLPSDFYVTLSSLAAGYRTVQVTELEATYASSKKSSAEFDRRVRTFIHGYRTLAHHKGLMSPFKHPLISWMLFSHKVIKWATSFTLTLIYIFSFIGMMTGSLFAPPIFFVGSIVGALGCAGFSPNIREKYPIVSKIHMTLGGLFASIVAYKRFKEGKYMDIWQPTSRTNES